MSDDKKANLFAKLAAQNNRPEPQPASTDTSPAEAPMPMEPAAEPSPTIAARPKSSPVRKKPEPVTGKRGNPDYCQANAYVSKKVRKSVDRVLLDMDGMDYSTLVEDLLKKWLKTRGVSE